jgi:undecaprenyl diphosphate synthase
MRLLFGRKQAEQQNVPEHLAVIMDGNGRWAKSKFLPRFEGHRAGAKSVRMLLEESLKIGIKYVTVYAFSSENWQRPQDEVSSLMKLFAYYLENELELFHKHKVRLRAIGDRSKLSPALQSLLLKAEEQTKDYSAMQFILAVSYGSRDEIVNAAKTIASDCLSGKLNVDEISNESIQNNLYAPDLPDVDLLIRTSNEYRISNFLLWQAAYAEIIVSPVFWPDFDVVEFNRCIQEYGSRVRKFGLTQDQIEQKNSAMV